MPASGEFQMKWPVWLQNYSGKTTPELLIPSVAPAPPAPGQIVPANDGRSSFGSIGVPDNSEVRIRSLNIFCTY